MKVFLSILGLVVALGFFAMGLKSSGCDFEKSRLAGYSKGVSETTEMWMGSMK